MKNIIKYYYNLNIDEYEEKDDYFILSIEDDVYIFKKVYQEAEEIKNICDLLLKNSIKSQSIIINKDDDIITNFDNNNYILIKINYFEENLGSNFFYINCENVDLNIAKVWEKKVDYYTVQINKLALGKEILINSFNYYVGMAENAISLYNEALKMPGYLRYSVVHRRIYYPNYAINYFDPTCMLIDVFVRDIAGYIKSKLYKDDIKIEECINLINNYRLSDKEVNILYARLLFPTYYFDVFDENILDNYDENSLLKIVEKLKEYELFLSKLQKELKNRYSILEIDWLKKEI